MVWRRRTRAVGLGVLGVFVVLALHFRGARSPAPGVPLVDVVDDAPYRLEAAEAVALNAPLDRPGLHALPSPVLHPSRERPWRVRGRVTDVTGRPVPDADVVIAEVVSSSEDRAEVRARTRTGPDGTYRLGEGGASPRPRSFLVSATSSDRGALSHFPSLRLLPIDADGEVIADLVLYPAGSLAGRVLDALGAPVQGAEVEVWARWPEGGTGTRRFPCDLDGRCSVAGLFGTIACRARAPGHRDGGSHLGEIPVGGTLSLELRVVRRSAGLRLRCVDGEEKPVPGLAVVAGITDDFDGGTALEGTTDVDGGVTLEGFAPDDLVSLRIGAGGEPWCFHAGLGDLAVGDLASVPVTTVPLLRGSWVRGIARASTGEHVGPGYPVSITAQGVRDDAVTDASGRLAFERPIPVGAARIDAGAMPDALDVEVAGGSCDLDIVVDPCVRVEARLLRPDGTPLRGRWPRGATRTGLSLALEAEPGGSSEVYALDLERRAEGVLGTWAPAAFARRSQVVLRTTAAPSRVLARSERIGPVRTGATTEVDLVIPPDALPVLRGRFHVRGSATPSFSALMMLTPLDPPGEPRHAFCFGTDRFELGFVLPGRYELLLSDMGRAAERTITVPATGILDLGDVELEPR